MRHALMTLLLSAMLLGPAAPLASGQQTPSQEELAAKRDAKLKAEFLKKAHWITDFDDARATAAKEHKLIFAYFTRSYAK